VGAVAARVLRTDHIDAQYGDGLSAALIQALPRATIDEAAKARVVVTLTGDLREELPILFSDCVRAPSGSSARSWN